MIIITGANRGIGNAIAKRLIQQNHKVIGLVRNPNNLEFDGIECDVTDYESIKNAYKKIKKIKKPVTGIINVAGVASMNMALTTDESTVQKLIQTNLVGTIYCCQILGPLLVREKKGSIINFSTIAVPLSLRGESVYVASKAGIEGFSKSFAREMADFNIKVNCISPGPINTELIKGVSSSNIEKIISRQIIQKQFEKDDVCNLVEVLLDDKTSSISGQILHIGGV
tara:strand:- start:5697 stop:6374 length:678 start_codon:yes stop_codon:yes gene_type:complete